MDARSQNKQKRRQRILNEARKVIAEQGFDALGTRSLAKSAGVTVPTIYNLIGSKNDVLTALMFEAVERIEARLTAYEGSPPLEMAEAIVTASTDLFATDETFYRAAVIAGNHVAIQCASNFASIQLAQRSVQMASNASQAAIDQRLLRGNICAHKLGEQMYASFRTAMHDWAFGLIDLSEFARQALRGFYICLAADAADGFRELLLRKISHLNKNALQLAD